ncbi:heavy metal translocating P-type ATPase [Phocicoccus pinnipedialis]|uniref:P-type Cu(+) transporter n=1 Tax=Phocicoccus pinnipedialis TaxID=110845 RepID=A0A6V7RCU9_9BACL|nr:heavy metal translocating P-type ATPase [Jeotgalicoccus pinnipedialis]MBP1939892.1 Cd2+/Zn2+-exporting ATPase [Jeotgalicoccus pinnipedialis]CAD2074749.1 putative cadmium-transporting ATPase [Jeotgalicoccus pinnipedialis]
MLNWMKKNKEMTNTIISAILIVIGIILQYQGHQELAVPSFILAFLIGGYFSAKAGLTELIKERHLNVDVLMILAAIGASIIGYWMEGALLIFIFSLSESLEKMANEKSKNAISELMNLTPDTARRYKEDGTIEVVLTKDLKIGDIVQVPRGETIPIDGSLKSDFAIVNEAAITGESVPVEKTKGMEVIGGTINEGDLFRIEVTVEDKDTLFSKIIRLVEEAQSSPSKTASFIESIESTYVKIVLIGVPVFILFVYFVLGWTFIESFYRGMVLLTVASPCALVASATPATLSAISRAAKRGMVFKGGQAIDNVQSLDAIIFDKTGTLTVGKPEVTSSYFVEGVDEETVKEVVKATEYGSTHPIASALVNYLDHTPLIELDHIEDITGKGFMVTHQTDVWKIGKHEFVITEDEISLDDEIGRVATQKENEGCTVIFVSKNKQLKGYFSLEDQLKPESKEAIARLNQMGIETIMVTGDNENTARHIAKRVGIKEVFANRMPDEKSSILDELRETFHAVGMVGDGINDAPALAKADIGFAMGSGTDIAMETADVVLIQDDLKQIPFAVGLSKKMKRIVIANVIFAMSVIVLLITANLFQVINLPMGVVGHEGSTILVILNGLRLLMYRDQ